MIVITHVPGLEEYDIVRAQLLLVTMLAIIT